eukprot:3148822-Rhodomonas_salina.1
MRDICPALWLSRSLGIALDVLLFGLSYADIDPTILSYFWINRKIPRDTVAKLRATRERKLDTFAPVCEDEAPGERVSQRQLRRRAGMDSGD